MQGALALFGDAERAWIDTALDTQSSPDRGTLSAEAGGSGRGSSGEGNCSSLHMEMYLRIRVVSCTAGRKAGCSEFGPRYKGKCGQLAQEDPAPTVRRQGICRQQSSTLTREAGCSQESAEVAPQLTENRRPTSAACTVSKTLVSGPYWHGIP